MPPAAITEWITDFLFDSCMSIMKSRVIEQIPFTRFQLDLGIILRYAVLVEQEKVARDHGNNELAEQLNALNKSYWINLPHWYRERVYKNDRSFFIINTETDNS
jgi:hypothetical protein